MAEASHPKARPGPLALLGRLTVLALALGLMWLPARLPTPGSQAAAAVAGLGFLLLAGDLLAQLVEPLGLPHLTGYLGAGLVAGPYVLHLLTEATVANLQQVNGLALALIAFAAGAELTVEMLRQGLRKLTYAVAAQSVVLLALLALVFFALRPLMPFLAGQPTAAVAGLALLWGVVSVVKSPAAVLGVLAETEAKGPLTTYAIAMVVVLDVVVLVLFQLALVAARALIQPGYQFAFSQLADVGHELLSSIAIGTTLGLFVALYLAWVDRGVILFLLGLAFGTAQLDRYLGYDAMLTFATAGFVVQNLTHQGPKLLDAIHRSGSVIFVIFFANAGAHLDLPILKSLWPVALVLASARALATAGAASLASKLADDTPAVRRWGWAPLISQAGVALGIAVAAEATFPAFGAGFRSLAVAVIGINEAVGPILFKLALTRTGEVPAERPPTESEAAAPANP